MNVWNSLAIGAREILGHKFRSLLTMLGVILGVASLLTTFALIEGLARSSREMMNSMGGVERVNVITDEPPAEQAAIADTSPGRTVADAEAITSHARLVTAVSPIYDHSVLARRGSHAFTAKIRGVWPTHAIVNRHTVEHGRNLCQLDLDEASRVCVIGTNVIGELWPQTPGIRPIGETILLNNRPFRIVGIFSHYESEDSRRARREGRPRPPSKFGRKWDPYEMKNTTFLIPFTTMFYEFKSASGSSTKTSSKEATGAAGAPGVAIDGGPIYKLDELSFQVADPDNLKPAIDEVRRLLLATHRGVEDFTFDTRQEWSDAINETTGQIRLVGSLIASIALIVGGIGITNIMLASITERIREIGVRRAVGAKSRHIFTQIVVESIVVAVLGGLLGIAAAFGLMALIRGATEGASAPVVHFEAVLISFGFAVGIGICSGLYPAWKASRIQPIEALRYG